MQTEQSVAAVVSPLEYAGAPAGRKSRLDPMGLASHLAGWFLVLLMVRVVGLFIVPRFEQIFANYRVGLPDVTRQVLSFSRAERDWPFRLLLIAGALAHSFAAAWWYRRTTEPRKLVYRLALMVLLVAALLIVLAGLCLPLLSGTVGVSSPGPAATPTTPAPAPAQ